MAADWLDLLLAGASVEAIQSYRDERIRAAADPAAVERQAGAALRLHALLDQRRRRVAELTALNDIAAQLTSTHPVDELLKQITVQARRLLGADLSYIGVVDGEDFVIKVASGAFTTQPIGLQMPRTAGMAGLVMSRAEPVWTSDYTTETAFSHESLDTVAAAEQIRALLGVPLTVGEHVLGALFACKRVERHFDDDEIGLLSALAAHAAIAISNATKLTQYRETARQLRAANQHLEQTLAWDRQLSGVVLRGGGVDELITEIAAAVTGQLILVDADAGAPAELIRNHPDLPAVFAGSAVEPSVDDRVVCIEGGRTQLVSIVAGHEVLGALILTGSENRDRDRLLLERAAPVLALATVRERAATEATRLARDAMVVDLLGRPADPSGLGQRMRNTGLDPGVAYCIVAAQPDKELRRVRRSDIVAEMPTGTVVAVDGARLVAVVPGEYPASVAERWSAVGRGDITAGVAGPSRSPADLHHVYREAVTTMNALLALGRTGAVITADQLGIYRILLSHTGRRELQAQYKEMLGPVIAEQKRRNLPMLATLKAYLDHGCRATATAHALGVHVNTVYQRIAVLDRLLGPGWREPPRSSDLQILLRIVPEPDSDHG